MVEGNKNAARITVWPERAGFDFILGIKIEAL